MVNIQVVRGTLKSGLKAKPFPKVPCINKKCPGNKEKYDIKKDTLSWVGSKQKFTCQLCSTLQNGDGKS